MKLKKFNEVLNSDNKDKNEYLLAEVNDIVNSSLTYIKDNGFFIDVRISGLDTNLNILISISKKYTGSYDGNNLSQYILNSTIFKWSDVKDDIIQLYEILKIKGFDSELIISYYKTNRPFYSINIKDIDNIEEDNISYVVIKCNIHSKPPFVNKKVKSNFLNKFKDFLKK